MHAVSRQHDHSDAPDPRSPAEAAIWPLLQPLGFVCQYRRQGYILDFYHPGQKLAVEIDGKQHAQRRDYDLKRDERFADVDIVTVRVPAWRALYRTQQAAEYVAQALDRRKTQSRVQMHTRRRPAAQQASNSNGISLNAALMRSQYAIAKDASDEYRRWRAGWVSPFDTSKRGTVTVIEPDAGTSSCPA